jgi:hypothetical protein
MRLLLLCLSLLLAFLLSGRVALCQGQINPVEPSQESLDAAIGNATKLTVMDGVTGRQLLTISDSKEIAKVKECLRIKLQGLFSAHGHSQWIFVFLRGTARTEIRVDRGSIEWSRWSYKAQLGEPKKLDGWLKQHRL